MPPAWSSLPLTGLNFTSTNPSLIFSSVFAAHANVASPDCFNTLGREGAVSSFTTSHLALPLPVIPVSQPLGSSPGFVSSKVIFISAVAARANTPNATRTSAAFHVLFTWPRVVRKPCRASLLKIFLKVFSFPRNRCSCVVVGLSGLGQFAHRFRQSILCLVGLRYGVEIIRPRARQFLLGLDIFQHRTDAELLAFSCQTQRLGGGSEVLLRRGNLVK